ncbi:outer membrane protein with beta-barrel domain [Mucilaginibacter gracilis]|uniref:Outer membrane protein with beta-barrel domain n=1 Tax=Mucilaginibacter gracilis TaxID=423350 RepID=A0A495J1V2_9SPHI|nr:porin family protein [Mucilaginibacter gracilis]RKR82907.1 outer membrane protein with beta-barrel domain [Mucilaginibacter gracilis]
MKIKKLHLLISLSTLIAAANTANAQTTVGVKAGVNFSNVMMKDESGNKINTQSIPGMVVGLTVDVPVAGDFYIQPAAQYSRKGYKQETGGFYGSATNFKVNASYIEVPVNLLYKPHVGTGNLLLGAGPYIGYGTGGSWKSDNDATIGDINVGKKGDVIFKNNAMDGGDVNSYLYGKPFDYGLNFLAGYELFNKLSAQLGAQLGLANLQPHADGATREGKLKNSGFGISLGYKF